jgi:hypothetical protein
MNTFFFWIQGNPTLRKAHFVGLDERVKPRLSQTLTRDARPDSNSRPVVQISNPLHEHAFMNSYSFLDEVEGLIFFFLFKSKYSLQLDKYIHNLTKLSSVPKVTSFFYKKKNTLFL